jgi:hypothetical protein
MLSRKQKFNYWENPEKTARYDRIINELCVVVRFIVGCVVIPGNENILFYLISGIDGKGWGYLGGGYLG